MGGKRDKWNMCLCKAHVVMVSVWDKTSTVAQVCDEMVFYRIAGLLTVSSLDFYFCSNLGQSDYICWYREAQVGVTATICNKTATPLTASYTLSFANPCCDDTSLKSACNKPEEKKIRSVLQSVKVTSTCFSQPFQYFSLFCFLFSWKFKLYSQTVTFVKYY